MKHCEVKENSLGPRPGEVGHGGMARTVEVGHVDRQTEGSKDWLIFPPQQR